MKKTWETNDNLGKHLSFRKPCKKKQKKAQGNQRSNLGGEKGTTYEQPIQKLMKTLRKLKKSIRKLRKNIRITQEALRNNLGNTSEKLNKRINQGVLMKNIRTTLGKLRKKKERKRNTQENIGTTQEKTWGSLGKSQEQPN